jgi:AhpD family alkylhydroperoxidase
MFIAHTHESAPDRSKIALSAAERQFGFVPDALARMAESPSLVEAFGAASRLFDHTSLGPIEREVVALVMARDLGCEYCRALHTTILSSQGNAELAGTVLGGRPLDDARLEALARYTRRVLETRGAASDEDLAAFWGAGWDKRAALDVVVGVGTYTFSIFANRLTRARIDPAFQGERRDTPSR